MKVLISAAEASSDTHGAELLRALRAEIPRGTEIDAFGIGGPKLQAAGLRIVVDARELLSMGFTEVLGRLPRILRALNRVTRAAEAERPDVAVVIDYPDFHFKLAKRLKAQGVPIVYYVPPKVWVWRKGRTRTLRDLFARVLCIFPFEEQFLRDAGVPVIYVGNPLLDELPLGITREAARAKLGIGAREKVLLAMAGSRPSELKYHLETVLQSAVQIERELRKRGEIGEGERLRVLMPLPETANLARVTALVDQWQNHFGPILGSSLDVRVSSGDSAHCMLAADAGLVKSGTSTLEAALLGCPHVIFYQVSWLSRMIFKHLIRYRGPVGLSNLIEWKEGRDLAVSELLGDAATPEKLAAEAVELMVKSDRRAQMLVRFDSLRARLRSGAALGPSLRAAREILAVIEKKPALGSENRS